MCTQKCLARRVLITRGDALLLQDRGNGRPRHAMTQILQRALDAGGAPDRILGRHPHGQAANLQEHAGPSRPTPRVRPFPAMSCRCQRRIVSGVTIVATSARIRRSCSGTTRRVYVNSQRCFRTLRAALIAVFQQVARLARLVRVRRSQRELSPSLQLYSTSATNAFECLRTPPSA